MPDDYSNLDDYSNPDNPGLVQSQMADQTPTDYTSTAGVSDTAADTPGGGSDPFNTYMTQTQQFFNSLVGGASTPSESAQLAAQGGNITKGGTPTEPLDATKATNWFQSVTKGFSDLLGFPDTPAGKTESAKLLGTGAGLAIAGLGQGYMASQKLAQEKKLAEDKLAVERQLVESQTGIAQQKMANQNFGNMQFQPPAATGGLIGSRVKFNPTYKQG